MQSSRSAIISYLVDEFLILPKLTYFLLNFTTYTCYTYLIMYCKNDLNISESEFSLYIFTTSAFTQFLMAPAWTYIADRYKRHRAVTIIACFCFGSSAQFLMWRPYDSWESKPLKIFYVAVINAIVNGCGAAFFPLVDHQVITNFYKNTPAISASSVQTQPGTAIQRDPFDPSSLPPSSSTPSPSSRKDTYGKQRLWGSLGLTASTIVVGILTDLYGYNAMFYTCAISSISFALLVSLFFPTHQQELEADYIESMISEAPSCDPLSARDIKVSICDSRRVSASQITGRNFQHSGSSHPSNTSVSDLDPDEITGSLELPSGSRQHRPNIMTLLGNPEYSFFLLVVFLIGLSKHILSILSVQFIVLKFDTSNFVVSLTQVPTLLPEVLLFYYGHYLLSSVGIYWLMIFAQVATVTRCLVLGWIPASWLPVVYLVESLRGVSTACLTLASVQLSHELSPPGLEAVAQGTMVSILHGLSSGFSGLFSGLVLAFVVNNNQEEFMIFTGYACLSVIGLLILKWGVMDNLLFRFRKNTTQNVVSQ